MHRVNDLVDAARTRVAAVSPEQLARELSCAKELVLIDVREEDELDDAGLIDGATHIPRGLLEFRADPTHPLGLDALKPGRRTVLYSETGNRSALAATALHAMGYEDLAHLDGGIRAWRDAGFATTIDLPPTAEPADRDAPARGGRARTHAMRLIPIALAVVATIATATAVVRGLGGTPRSPMAVAAPSPQDPLINRFGVDSDYGRCRLAMQGDTTENASAHGSGRSAAATATTASTTTMPDPLITRFGIDSQHELSASTNSRARCG